MTEKLKLAGLALALTFSTAAVAADCCKDMACCKEGADCCDEKADRKSCCDEAKHGEHAGHGMGGTRK
jgi:hypothetical protein